jgi:hypothetical protein
MHSHLTSHGLPLLQFRSRGGLLLSSVPELDVCAHRVHTAYLFWVTTAAGQSRRHYAARLRGRMDGTRLRD